MGRAIVRSPKAFLMDEPLSNLDAKLRVQTRSEISRLQHQLATTMLYVTHDQVEALTLGDRIAVMRAGSLQQVGPPGDLYSRPSNLFVAGFIGSPSMNFLPGDLDDDRLRSPLGDVSVSDEQRRQLAAGVGADGRGLIIGIRPEDFEDAMLLGDRASGHTFKTRIDVLESLGSEYNAYFEIESPRVASSDLEDLAQDSGTADLGRSREGVPMIARLPRASRIRQGQDAELWFDTSRLYAFDAETGRNLL
jgi:multiple sugar transport system ATP-binding protein